MGEVVLELAGNAPSLTSAGKLQSKTSGENNCNSFRGAHLLQSNEEEAISRLSSAEPNIVRFYRTLMLSGAGTPLQRTEPTYDTTPRWHAPRYSITKRGSGFQRGSERKPSSTIPCYAHQGPDIVCVCAASLISGIRSGTCPRPHDWIT